VGRVVVIIVSLVVIGLPGCAPDPAEAMRPIDFDPVGWKGWADPTSDLRMRMVPALLRDHRLVGQTTAQIEGLLGPTRLTEVDAGFEVCHYSLGRARPKYGAWGYPFLSVRFADGRVVEVFHTEGMGAVSSHQTRQE
jgi:hypothetical protein